MPVCARAIASVQPQPDGTMPSGRWGAINILLCTVSYEKD
jgi:hypothetical protein